LRDLIRRTASQIRQSVVYDDHHGFPTGLGQIVIKDKVEALNTFGMFLEEEKEKTSTLLANSVTLERLSTEGWDGARLVVTLARTDSPTELIAGPIPSPDKRVIDPSSA
jgi:hypothetical protein